MMTPTIVTGDHEDTGDNEDVQHVLGLLVPPDPWTTWAGGTICIHQHGGECHAEPRNQHLRGGEFFTIYGRFHDSFDGDSEVREPDYGRALEYNSHCTRNPIGDTYEVSGKHPSERV